MPKWDFFPSAGKGGWSRNWMFPSEKAELEHILCKTYWKAILRNATDQGDFIWQDV